MAKKEERDALTNAVLGLIDDLHAVVDKATDEAFTAGENAARERMIAAIGGKSLKPVAVALKKPKGGAWIKAHTRNGVVVPRHFRPVASYTGKVSASKTRPFTSKLKSATEELKANKAVRLTHFGLKRKARRRHMGGVEDGVIKLEHHLQSNSVAHINSHQIRAQLKPLSTGTIFRTILVFQKRGVLTRVGMGEYSVNQNKITAE